MSAFQPWMKVREKAHLTRLSLYAPTTHSLIFYFLSPSNTSRQPEILTLQHLPWSCLSEWFLPFQSQCTIWTLWSLLACQICLPTSPHLMSTRREGLCSVLFVCFITEFCAKVFDRMGFLGLSEKFIHLHIDKFPLVSYGLIYRIKWPPSPAICQPGFEGTNEKVLILPKEEDHVFCNWNKAWFPPRYTRGKCSPREGQSDPQTSWHKALPRMSASTSLHSSLLKCWCRAWRDSSVSKVIAV